MLKLEEIDRKRYKIITTFFQIRIVFALALSYPLSGISNTEGQKGEANNNKVTRHHGFGH